MVWPDQGGPSLDRMERNTLQTCTEPNLHVRPEPGGLSPSRTKRNTLRTCKEPDLQRWAGAGRTESELLYISPHPQRLRKRSGHC